MQASPFQSLAEAGRSPCSDRLCCLPMSRISEQLTPATTPPAPAPSPHPAPDVVLVIWGQKNALNLERGLSMAGKALIRQLSWPFQLWRTRALSLVLSFLCFYEPLRDTSPHAWLPALATGGKTVLAAESPASCNVPAQRCAQLKPSLSPPNWLARLLPLCRRR